MKQTHTVDIWLTRLSDVDEHMRRAYERLLNPVEKTRLSRYVVEHAKEQYVVARALLRTALSRYADVLPDAWEFGSNSHGKPHIIAPDIAPSLKFNISHTSGVIACAINCGREVGIDVEYIDGKHDYEDLVHLVLAEAEMIRLNRLPPPERRERFYVLWTLKEAYLKAMGTGLSIPLFELNFNPEQKPVCMKYESSVSGDITQWHFETFMPTAKHALALAVSASPDRQMQVKLHWTIPSA
jgi:4'-phosphopantetheinyl transferase